MRARWAGRALRPGTHRGHIPEDRKLLLQRATDERLRRALERGCSRVDVAAVLDISKRSTFYKRKRAAAYDFPLEAFNRGGRPTAAEAGEETEEAEEVEAGQETDKPGEVECGTETGTDGATDRAPSDEQDVDDGRTETWGTDSTPERSSSVEALDQKLDTLLDAVSDAVAE